jgi:2'-5' RNA ligase
MMSDLDLQKPHPKDLAERYTRLWDSSIAAIRAGDVEIDPYLSSGQVDTRRGYTLIVRPSPPVKERIASFLEDLRRIDPHQYYYDPADLHVTFLSLFTATVDYQRFFAQTERYLAACKAAALQALPPFTLEFSGVTASRGAVIVQGYPQDGSLNAARDRLREELRVRGLGEGLDTRYRLETTHITALRFRSPLRAAQEFSCALEKFRQTPFGAARITSLDLVSHDWYMARKHVHLIQRFQIS